MRLFILSLLAISFLTFSSCSKYSDGPSVSFASRKARLCNDWILESYFKNETDKNTIDFDSIQDTINRNGTIFLYENISNNMPKQKNLPCLGRF